MNRALEEDWFTTTSYWRYEAEPPDVGPSVGGPVTIDGTEYDLVPRVPAEWAHQHRRRGVQIEDPTRNITYRVTLSPVTREIDHLEVIVRGVVPDRSNVPLPLARIRRVAANELAEMRQAGLLDKESAFQVKRPGAHRNPDSTIPSAEEIARHLREHRTRESLAKEYGRTLRTIDRWISNARREIPEEMPEITQGKRNDQPNKKKEKE